VSLAAPADDDDDAEAAPVFSLHMKNQRRQIVAPYSVLQIPFIFAPRLIQNVRSRIFVDAKAQQVRWAFPILGIAEGPTSAAPQEFATVARNRVAVVLQRQLPGLSGDDMKAERFSIELQAPPKYDAFLEQALSIELLTTTLPSESAPIKVRVLFEPLRPCNIKATLCVSKRSGGCWKFPVSFVANEPPADQTFVLKAPIRKTARYTFGLQNISKTRAAFKASLTPESASCFRVSPSRGVLAPAGSNEQTMFTVHYSPVSYGKVSNGTLLIETDTMMWRFDLKGTHPQYVAPRAGKSSIDNHMNAAVMSQLDKKHTGAARTNFLTKNARAIRAATTATATASSSATMTNSFRRRPKTPLQDVLQAARRGI
jgi:hypothetical protein